jgi:RND superfamily putative drug exporter
VTRWAIARPRAALVVWAVAIALLALLGTGVEGRLVQSIFVLPGGETARAIELSRDEFGESVFIPALLEGPPREVERQGKALVAKLASEPDTRVLSPWDRAPGSATLRPRRDAAMVVVAINRPYEEIFDTTAERIRELVHDQVAAPVRVSITGMPVIGNAIKRETYESAREAELIAMPILAVVLLLVFRAPFAAAIPGAIGLATLFAGSGLIWILAGFLRIDPLAIPLASMMGLALGVDYSLLIVTRFREEMAAGATPPQAATVAMATAGRTVAFAGAALVVALAVGMAVVPGDILVSAAVGVLAATVIAIGSAFLAIPAALTLFGAHLDRFGFARKITAAPPRWIAAVASAVRQPGLVAGLILLPLLALAAPAFGLNPGPPDVAQLPPDDEARRDFERVSEVMGPGWAAPFDVLLVERNGLLAEPQRLRVLERWQRRLARSGNVANVVGPGRLAGRVPDMSSSGEELQRGAEGLARLGRGLRRAEAAVRELRHAQGVATAAAQELAEGNETASAGSATLAARLLEAADGAGRIADAIERMAAGGSRMLAAMRRGRKAARRLERGLFDAADVVRFRAITAANLLAVGLRLQAGEINSVRPRAVTAEEELEKALDALQAMGIGKSDPNYNAALQAVREAFEAVARRDADTREPFLNDPQSLARELELFRSRVEHSARDAERLSGGLGRLARRLRAGSRGAGRLADGIARLGGAAERLDEGSGRLADAATRLQEGLLRGADATDELAGGLKRLASGNAQLADGMARGQSRVVPLILGLKRGAEGAERMQRRSRETLSTLARSRGLFDSAYFVLAAIDGAPADRRRAAQVVLNVENGGEAGRVLVVPKTAPNDERTRELYADLRERSRELGDRLGVETAVGGTGGALSEYDERASGRLVWLILALAVVSYLALVPIFGSLLLPLAAVLLNLVSVGAAFGSLALLFQGDAPPLGGPGYIDVVALSAMYTVIFGLSLDYQVFLIGRMREGWRRNGDTRAAIRYGLERTAAVVTGAAAIMVAVFLAFATTDIATTSQFGIGLAIAVFLDATLVRLMLLPAIVGLFGNAAWRGPRWAQRLADGQVH